MKTLAVLMSFLLVLWSQQLFIKHHPAFMQLLRGSPTRVPGKNRCENFTSMMLCTIALFHFPSVSIQWHSGIDKRITKNEMMQLGSSRPEGV